MQLKPTTSRNIDLNNANTTMEDASLKNLTQSRYAILQYLSSLSATSSFDDEENGEWNEEGEDGEWSDDDFNDDMGYEQYDSDDYQSPDSEYEE